MLKKISESGLLDVHNLHDCHLQHNWRIYQLSILDVDFYFAEYFDAGLHLSFQEDLQIEATKYWNALFAKWHLVWSYMNQDLMV